MAIFLALLSALGFGAGDFAGASASKRTPVLTVVASSHLLGLILVVVAAPFMADRFGWSDLGIGAIGGLAGLVGVLLLYRGLAVGPMSVVAPLTAVTSAAIPAIWGFASGERPSAVSLCGLAAGLVAIALVSRPSAVTGAQVQRSTITDALLAGSGFGAFFIAFDMTAEGTAPWPIVGARVASTLVLALILTRRSEPFVAPAGVRGAVAAAGVCDVGANLAFLLATQRGLLSLVSVLSSLYPVVTVGLARVIYRERVAVSQLAGLALALTATTLIALG